MRVSCATSLSAALADGQQHLASLTSEYEALRGTARTTPADLQAVLSAIDRHIDRCVDLVPQLEDPREGRGETDAPGKLEALLRRLAVLRSGILALYVREWAG